MEGGAKRGATVRSQVLGCAGLADVFNQRELKGEDEIRGDTQRLWGMGRVNVFVVSIVRTRWCALFLYQYFSVCFNNFLSSRATKASLS